MSLQAGLGHQLLRVPMRGETTPEVHSWHHTGGDLQYLRFLCVSSLLSQPFSPTCPCPSQALCDLFPSYFLPESPYSRLEKCTLLCLWSLTFPVMLRHPLSMTPSSSFSTPPPSWCRPWPSPRGCQPLQLLAGPTGGTRRPDSRSPLELL